MSDTNFKSCYSWVESKTVEKVSNISNRSDEPYNIDPLLYLYQHLWYSQKLTEQELNSLRVSFEVIQIHWFDFVCLWICLYVIILNMWVKKYNIMYTYTKIFAPSMPRSYLFYLGACIHAQTGERTQRMSALIFAHNSNFTNRFHASTISWNSIYNVQSSTLPAMTVNVNINYCDGICIAVS